MNQPTPPAPTAVVKFEGEEVTKGKTYTPHEQLKFQMESRKDQFMSCLPANVTFARFQAAVMTAVISNPELLRADRVSLMLAAIKCASDGLVPDNREAAFVIFNAKLGEDAQGKAIWGSRVQYMPMMHGLVKKILRAGFVVSVTAEIVYEIDRRLGTFKDYRGDRNEIVHEPYYGAEERGPIIAAYCIAVMRDGTKAKMVMPYVDIEKVRKVSKSGSMNDYDVKKSPGSKVGDPKGIWKDWPEEMAKKTVFRRLSKWLPQSAEEIDRLFENDDTIDALGFDDEAAPTVGDKPLTATERAAASADAEAADKPPQIEHDKQPDLKDVLAQKGFEKPQPEPVIVTVGDQSNLQPSANGIVHATIVMGPEDVAGSFESFVDENGEPPPPPPASPKVSILETILKKIEAAKDLEDLDKMWNGEIADFMKYLNKIDTQQAISSYGEKSKSFSPKPAPIVYPQWPAGLQKPKPLGTIELSIKVATTRDEVAAAMEDFSEDIERFRHTNPDAFALIGKLRDKKLEEFPA